MITTFISIAVVLFVLGVHAICFVAYEDAQRAKSQAKRLHDHGV